MSSSLAIRESRTSSMFGVPIIIPPPWMYSNAALVLVEAGVKTLSLCPPEVFSQAIVVPS